MLKVGVILPFHNEQCDIYNQLKSLEKYIDRDKYNVCVFLLDNLSSDSSLSEIKFYSICSKFNLNLISNERLGKSEVLFDCAEKILNHNCHIYILSDADNTYLPHDLNTVIENFVANSYDIGCGERLDLRLKHNFINVFGGWVFNKIFSLESQLIFKRKDLVFKDSLSGFRIFSNNVFKRIFINEDFQTKIKPKGFEIEAYFNLITMELNLKNLFFNVDYKKRVSSTSKLKVFRDGYSILKYSLKCYWIIVKKFQNK